MDEHITSWYIHFKLKTRSIRNGLVYLLFISAQYLSLALIMFFIYYLNNQR